MAVTVPLQAVPSQVIQAVLNGQSVQLNIYQKMLGLFMDVLVNNSPIVIGVACLNLNRVVRSAYLGFLGDLAFSDTQGSNDPIYTGLGSRFQLIYYTPADLAPFKFQS